MVTASVTAKVLISYVFKVRKPISKRQFFPKVTQPIRVWAWAKSRISLPPDQASHSAIRPNIKCRAVLRGS